MLPNQTLENLRSQDSKVSKESLLWSVNLKLTHLDWTPEATLVHFQGHYLNTCELDYKILHGEIQRTAKTKAEVDIGEFCLVEDVTSASWFRGRVQGRTNDLFEVYLIDHGNILTVDATYRPHVSSELFTLPPKVVCGFFANVLLVRNCPHLLVDKYFSCLVGQSITGYVQARLPYEVLVLEVPDINSDLVLHGFGRLVDRDTFLLLVELLTEVTVKRSMESEIDTPFDQSKEVELFIKPPFWTKYKDVLKCAESKLICGTRAKVQLTAALYPRMFFFQMVGVERELCKISEKLSLMCEHGNQQQRRGSAEKISLLCSVKGKDGNWYRGFLSFFPVSSHVKVLFVDYGFFETVSVDNIRRLPKEFLLTPIMALPCSLSMNGQVKMPKSQLLNLLKSSLQGGVLDVEISGFDDEHHLYYLTVSGVEDDPVKEPQPFQMAPLTKAESLSEGNQLSTQQDLMNKELFFRKLLEQAMKAEGLGADSVFEGFVVGAQNPNKFWIRTQKRNDEFNEMMAGIGDYFRQVKLDEEVLLNPELGDLCCAMYEKDMHFYRAVVTDKLVHGAEVLFIDFGNIEKVPTMLIKNIPKAFAKIPGFAIDCTLANLILCDDIWPVAVCDFFRQAVFNKLLQVHVVQMEKNQLAVDLNEMERGESQSIAKLLVTSDKAEYISLKSVVHSDTNETKNVKYSQKRATAIGRTTKQIKKSNKNDKKAPVARTFKALEIKPGWMLNVRCFSFISVKDFWCQSLNKASELKVLNDKIHQYYSAHTVALQAEDSCCVAKSPVDNKWYRGLITERENRFATVLLVDYGYTIQVDQQYLQAIMPEFVHLERQAFRCCLYNPQTSAGFKDFCDWSPVMCKLKNIVRNHTDGMQCLVVSQLDNENQGMYYVVDLHDSQTQQSLINSVIKLGITMQETAKEQSAVSPESFIFSSYDLRPGMEEQVFVTHVSNQWEVYCHLERNADIIHKLEENISELSHELNNDSTRTVVQTLCLAKYLDGNWYRAVLKNNPSPFHVSVVYVDYGNTHVLEKSEVMSIPKGCADLLYTPMQALRFHLDLVPKEESSVNVKEWLKKAVLNKSARAIIVGLNESGSFNVELFCEERSINEKVKELFHKIEKETFSRVSVHVDTKNKEAQTRERKASKKPIPLKSERKKIKAKKVYQQPQNCKKKTVCPAAPMPHKKLRAGFRAKCFVSHFDSANSFFLQLSDDESAILKMVEDLNSLTFRHPLAKTKCLSIGDLVLAEYEEDGALYRAEIKDYEKSFTCCVNFVDYGNSAIVKNEGIYPVPKEFLSLPRFSIPCSLLDTCTKNDFLTDSKVQKPLLVEFVHQSRCTWNVKVQILEDEAVEEVLAEKKVSPTCLVETNVSGRSSKNKSIKDICENQTSQKSSTVEVTNLEVTNDDVKSFTPIFVKAKAKEQAILLSAVGVGRFYARLKRTNNMLISLEHHIAQELYEHKMLISEDIKKGLECVVQVNENLCQRAVVQQTFGEKSKVFLLDHGITRDISTSSIRQQHCNYLKRIPNFAILCEINCLEYNKRDDDQRLWQEIFKPATGKEVELVFLEYNEVDQFWMVEMIRDQLFLMDGDEASVSLDKEIKLSIENAEQERASDSYTLLKPLFSPSEIKSYMGYVTAVTSPFDFNIVIEDSSLAFKKVPIMVDDGLEGKRLSKDTLEFKSNNFPNHEDSSCNKPLSKKTNLLTVYPCLIRGVKPVGETNEWSDETIGFFRQHLYWKRLQIFLKEFLWGKHWGVDVLVEGSHVAKKLVDAGHAEYTDVLLELRFLEPLEDPYLESNTDEDRYENKKVSDQQQ